MAQSHKSATGKEDNSSKTFDCEHGQRERTLTRLNSRVTEIFFFKRDSRKNNDPREFQALIPRTCEYIKKIIWQKEIQCKMELRLLVN